MSRKQLAGWVLAAVWAAFLLGAQRELRDRALERSADDHAACDVATRSPVDDGGAAPPDHWESRFRERWTRAMGRITNQFLELELKLNASIRMSSTTAPLESLEATPRKVRLPAVDGATCPPMSVVDLVIDEATTTTMQREVGATNARDDHASALRSARTWLKRAAMPLLVISELNWEVNRWRAFQQQLIALMERRNDTMLFNWI